MSDMPDDLIAEAIAEAFGERCPDFEPACWCCAAWAQYDALKTAREANVGQIGRLLRVADDKGFGDEAREVFGGRGISAETQAAIDAIDACIRAAAQNGHLLVGGQSS